MPLNDMDSFYKAQLDKLSSLKSEKILDNILRGVEKENIRMDSKTGCLSNYPHPEKLGSALTHPSITTDFSENLIECVTSPIKNRDNLFQELEDLMIFVNKILSNKKNKEFLWPYSMPYLPDSKSVSNINIAKYGSSNIAKMKETYRKGLDNRYGKAMQMIAGIHYNFSFPKELLLKLGPLPGFENISDDQDIITNRYMGVMRGFLRYQWIIPFLFGASPICFKGSVVNSHKLPSFLSENNSDKNILFSNTATSLRLSDIGYQNKSQSQINICTNNIQNYAQSLLDATNLPYSEFELIKTKSSNGEYNQLNSNLLQIENEFYSTIRPKSTPQGEYRPAVALSKFGVEYLEIRALDLNPLEPLGLSKKTSAFIDLFLTHLLLQKGDLLDLKNENKNSCNFKSAVENSRNINSIVCIKSDRKNLCKSVRDILISMKNLAIIMDESETNSNNIYTKALQKQIDKTNDLSLLPSNKFINSWQKSGLKFNKFINKLAIDHQNIFNQKKLSEDKLNNFINLARDSKIKQTYIEKNDDIDFEVFLNNYFSQNIK